MAEPGRDEPPDPDDEEDALPAATSPVGSEELCLYCQRPLPARAPRVFVYEEAKAIQAMLVDRLDAEDGWVLLQDAAKGGTQQAPSRTGVYRLRYGGEGIYVGKADGSLLERLNRHYNRIRGRHGLDVGRAECTYVVLPPPWDVRTSETALISYYEDLGQTSWQHSGFGNKDQGQERDTQEPSSYDRDHPPLRDYEIRIPAGEYTVRKALRRVKEELPYWFRFQTKDRGGEAGWRADLEKTFVQSEDYVGPVEPYLVDLCRSHLTSWQLTYLPLGYILYKHRRTYDHGVVVYQRPL